MKIDEAILFLLHSEKGATAIEYTLIAAGVSIAIAGIVFVLGDNVSDLMDGVLEYL